MVLLHVCPQLERGNGAPEGIQVDHLDISLCSHYVQAALLAPVDQGVTTANMVIPLLTYWSLGTRSQSALVAAIIYSSVGPLLCPLAKCTPVGTQDLQ